MADPRNVAVLVGSLRKASFNRQMALAMREAAPASLSLGIVAAPWSPCATASGAPTRCCS